MHTSRRTVLSGTGIAVSFALTGCVGGDDGDSDDGSDGDGGDGGDGGGGDGGDGVVVDQQFSEDDEVFFDGSEDDEFHVSIEAGDDGAFVHLLDESSIGWRWDLGPGEEESETVSSTGDFEFEVYLSEGSAHVTVEIQ